MFNFISLASRLLFILLLTMILTPSIGYAAEKFIVRVIYFKPQDASPINHEKYNEIIKDMQEFFWKEMIRLGYGNKTFRIETDDNDDLIIHTVNGRHAGEHYTGEIFNAYYQKISKEIPFAINNTTNREQQDNIYIVIVGGVEIVADGLGSPWGGGWTFSGNAVGGSAIVNENFENLYPNHFKSIIGHEFGHALEWQHNTSPNALMGPLPFGSFGQITDFEARLLNKHHFFNDVHILNGPPEVVGDVNLKSVGKNTIRLQIEVQSQVGLYHCQISKGQDYLGSDDIEGQNDFVEIDIPRHTLFNGDTIDVLIMDINGNKKERRFRNIQLPGPGAINEGKLKHLTIRHKHPESLVPINNPLEWVGWENAGVFEKAPNGNNPKLPAWYIHVPKLDEWDSWFYSHAISRFAYDVSGGEYNRFDAHFYLPNPCDGNADVEVICLADGVKIYQSEVLRSPEAQNKHFQIDFPNDTKEFTIEITDAGDGIGCDHFVFGEAKVLLLNDDANLDVNEIKNEDPDDVICKHCIPDTDIEINVVPEGDLGINPEHKLTTKWATIKAR